MLLRINSIHKQFITPADKSSINIKVHCNLSPDLKTGKLIFDSKNWWRIYKNENNYMIQILSPISPTSFQPVRLAVFDSKFKNGDLYIHSCKNQAGNSCENLDIDDSKYVDPLNPALDMLLMLNILPNKSGVILHGCGMIVDNNGIVFCGCSGSGKSTLADIWKEHSIILGDERIIVRRIENNFWIYGTPWHKNVQMCSPKRAILKKIYIIEHGTVNKINQLQRTEAISKLLVRCFPPFYNRESMEQTLSFFDLLIRKIPCYELYFVPNENIINFVRDLK